MWWAPYNDFLPEWYRSYLFFESIAKCIYTYENRFVPGLLQTRAYAEAIIRARHTDDEQVKRLVDLRMQRQQNVLRRGTPQLWAIVDNAALVDGPDNPAIMRQQIEFLMTAAELPGVKIQVVTRGACAARSHSFSILRLRGSMLSEVIYLEHFESALFIDDLVKSDPYRQAWNEIGLAAEKPHRTLASLDKALHRFPVAPD